MIDKAKEAAAHIRGQGIKDVNTAIILGTGLGNLVKNLKVEKTLDYKDIPHFPVSTVEFHSGKLLFGTLEGKNVLVMNGRFHYYEGYTMQEITFPIRVMKLLGIKNLLVSNAAGAINLSFPPASLMIIDDHINMLPGNPLVGKNYDEFGPRFPDMSRPYDPEFITILEKIAKRENISVNKGVYVAWIGPNLETRAEYRFIKVMGADAVGMSTVPEAMLANAAGIKVAGMSCITNFAAGVSQEALGHEEVLETTKQAMPIMTSIIHEFVCSICK